MGLENTFEIEEEDEDNYNENPGQNCSGLLP